MNDTELRALAVYVSRETMLMDAENMNRTDQGLPLAYDESCGYTEACQTLEAELVARGIITADRVADPEPAPPQPTSFWGRRFIKR